MIAPGLWLGPVMHRRLRPHVRRFSYRTLWVALDLDRLQSTSRLLSINRFNLFSFHERDHADGGPGFLARKIRDLLARRGLAANGRIVLLTSPRVLGFVFNPLSVYFCHDRAGGLAAIVWEVSNTFGERHSYVLKVDGAEATIRQSAVKKMHVSPFIDMNILYRFRVAFADGRLAIGIVDEDRDGPLLIAAMTLHHAPLTNRAALAAFVRMPFSTLKTVAAIHWQALKLFARGVRVVDHPAGVRQAIGDHASSGAAPSLRDTPENLRAMKAESATAQ